MAMGGQKWMTFFALFPFLLIWTPCSPAYEFWPPGGGGWVVSSVGKLPVVWMLIYNCLNLAPRSLQRRFSPLPLDLYYATLHHLIFS